MCEQSGTHPSQKAREGWGTHCMVVPAQGWATRRKCCLDGSGATMSAAKNKKWIAGISAPTVAAVFVFLAFGFYYYVTTPAEIYVIVGNAFPPNFSPGFTADELANDLLAATAEIRAGAGKKVSQTNAQLGAQIASADRPPTYLPLRDPFPSFDVKLKGIRLSAVHEYAVSKRARHLIAIDTFARGRGNFRLRARLLDKPGDERHSVSAPVNGGLCPDW